MSDTHEDDILTLVAAGQPRQSPPSSRKASASATRPPVVVVASSTTPTANESPTAASGSRSTVQPHSAREDDSAASDSSSRAVTASTSDSSRHRSDVFDDEEWAAGGTGANTSFVCASAFYLILLAGITLTAAFVTQDFLSESERKAAEAFVSSSADRALRQLRWMQAHALRTSVTARNARERCTTCSDTAADVANIVNGMNHASSAASELLGLCAVHGDGPDFQVCPLSASSTLSVYLSPTNASAPATAQGIYHSSFVGELTATDFTATARVVTAVAGGAPVAAGSNSSRQQSVALARNITSASAVLSARQVNFDNVPSTAVTSATPATVRQTRRDNFAFPGNASGEADILRATSATGTSWLSCAVALPMGGRLLLNTETGSLAETNIAPLVYGSTTAPWIVSSVSIAASNLILAHDPTPLSTLCIVTDAGLVVTCAEDDADLLRDHRIQDPSASSLHSDVRSGFDRAIAKHRAASAANPSAKSGQYVKLIIKGGAVYVAAYTPLIDAYLIPSQRFVDVWLVGISLKPGSVDFRHNLQAQSGMVVFALVAIINVVFIVIFYVTFVKPMTDLRERMDAVSALDFSSIPDKDACDELTGVEKREEAKRNEALYPSTRLRDVRALYTSLFHVANALRSVVPFLPASFRPPTRTVLEAGDSVNPTDQITPTNRSDSPQHIAQNPFRASNQFGEELSSSDDDDGGSRSPRAESELSSISEIDLSAPSHVAGSGRGIQRQDTGMSSSTGTDASRSPASNNLATPSARPPQLQLRAPGQGTSNNRSRRPSLTPTGVQASPNLQSQHASTATLAAPKLQAASSAQQLSPTDAATPKVAKYTNDTQAQSAVVVHFQLYMRKAARNNGALAHDIQREFVLAALAAVKNERGSASALAPLSCTAVWTNANAEARACTAGLAFCAQLKAYGQSRGIFSSFRVSAGVAHGSVTVGVLGSAIKKFFVCDGPAVQRATIMASVGVHTHASVVVTKSIEQAVSMFAALRPVEVVEWPRTLRTRNDPAVQRVFQCLYMDGGRADEEWMYTLERRNQGPSNDPFALGFESFIVGDLKAALANFEVALAEARSKGIEDQYTTRKVQLLEPSYGGNNVSSTEHDSHGESVCSSMNSSIARKPGDSPSLAASMAPQSRNWHLARLEELFNELREAHESYARKATVLGVETMAFEV